jgi:hypothetical protein
MPVETHTSGSGPNDAIALPPAPTACMEPLIVDQLQLVPATLKLPADGQPHLLDGADQGGALGSAAVAAVDVFACHFLI